MITAHPRLSPTQLAAYDRDGFLVIDDVFPTEDLRRVDAEMDRVEGPEARQDGVDFRLQLGQRSDLAATWCADPRLLALVGAVVRPGIAIYSAKLVTKPPGVDDIHAVCHWHQDDAYYQDNSQSATRMSVWFPLADVGPADGCLRVVPGSHRTGLAPWALARQGGCTRALHEGAEMLPGAIEVPVRAGSVLLFHALLWHASAGNRGNRRRRAFIVSYQDALAERGNGVQHRILVPAA